MGVVYTSVIILKRIPTSWLFLCLYLEADTVEVFIVNNPFIDTSPIFIRTNFIRTPRLRFAQKLRTSF